MFFIHFPLVAPVVFWYDTRHMQSIKIIKRSGHEVVFDISKIENAIRKASLAVDYKTALSERRIRVIAAEVADICGARDRVPSAEEVQRTVGQRLELREAAAEVIRSNRRIRDNARKVAPFYLGDANTPEPPLNDRLPRHIDPKHNGAYKCVKRLGNALKEIMPGHYPASALNSLRKTTVSVLHDSLEPIYRSKLINKFDTLVDDIHDYLNTPDPHLTHEEHAENIAKFVKLWIESCYCNSDEFYTYTRTVIERQGKTPHRARTWRGRSRRSGSGLKGTRTQMMERQFKDFLEFLKTHPVCEIGQGKTVGARAIQFWAAHKKTYEHAAKATGEKRGYSGPKAIASAYRASKN